MQTIKHDVTTDRRQHVEEVIEIAEKLMQEYAINYMPNTHYQTKEKLVDAVLRMLDKNSS